MAPKRKKKKTRKEERKTDGRCLKEILLVLFLPPGSTPSTFVEEIRQRVTLVPRDGLGGTSWPWAISPSSPSGALLPLPHLLADSASTCLGPFLSGGRVTAHFHLPRGAERRDPNVAHEGGTESGEMVPWSWSSGDSFEALRCSLELREMFVENLC